VRKANREALVTVEVGLRGEASLTVTEEHTADRFGAGGVHVLATPVMIGLMENAAWRAVESALPQGETTVGTLVNVRHLAATPVGEQVVATAELVAIEGRRLTFHVTARDAHRPIGEGTHERTAVNLERFLSRLAGGGPSAPGGSTAQTPPGDQA
jgi:predicted thioesterase